MRGRDDWRALTLLLTGRWPFCTGRWCQLVAVALSLQWFLLKTNIWFLTFYCVSAGKQCAGAQLRADPLWRADSNRPSRKNATAQVLPVRPPADILQKRRPAEGPPSLPWTAGYGPDGSVGSARRTGPGPGPDTEECRAPPQCVHSGVRVCAVL